jgi:hypothetical protein
MTVVVSIIRPSIVIMANDSAISLEFPDRAEYETGRKGYLYEGVGLVTAWGARDGMNLGQYLDKVGVHSGIDDVDSLADKVHAYLATDYRPSDHGLGDVGFHIGGFTGGGLSRLFHSYWNTSIATEKGSDAAGYVLERHVPGRRGTAFMYNGRHDLAQTVLNTFFDELKRGSPLRIGRSAPGYATVAHLALRFAVEVTPQVGPPLFVRLLNRTNSSRTVRSDDLCPIDEAAFVPHCKALKIDVGQGPDEGAV